MCWDLKNRTEILQGLEENLRFTSYRYDPVVGKHFAYARFYDDANGRMLGLDPVKRGLNGYRYRDNDSVDYVDPTGEILGIVGRTIAGGIVGGIFGGAGGFISSAVSQKLSGHKVNWKKAAGEAVKGAVIGAAQGAMVASGVKIPGAVANAANFVAGTIGSAAEQGISRGRGSIGRSILGGIDNMIGNSYYGTGRLENLKNVTVRGVKAGAANAGLGYFADLVDPAPRLDVSGAAGLMAGVAGSLLMRDPRRCGSPSPFHAVLGYSMAKGYQYGVSRTGFGKRKKPSLMGFVGETLRGAVTGGVTSAAFYGAGKGIEKLWNGFFAGKGGSGSVIYGTDDIAKYEFNMIENPGPLAEMPNQPAKNFYGGRYNMEVLQKDKIMYRAGNVENPYGRWFTSEPPASVANVRIDTAVKPYWINPKTGACEASSYIDNVYAIKIPKGTTVYTGPVGPQGGAYMGGYNIMQTYIDSPWSFEVLEKTLLQ